MSFVLGRGRGEIAYSFRIDVVSRRNSHRATSGAKDGHQGCEKRNDLCIPDEYKPISDSDLAPNGMEETNLGISFRNCRVVTRVMAQALS